MPLRIVEKLWIEGFRGIRRLAEPLKLRGFNVIVGPNNAGKTAVLEALYMLNHPSARDPLYDNTVTGVVASLHSGMHSIVYGYQGRALIHCEMADETVLEVVIEAIDSGMRYFAALVENGEQKPVDEKMLHKKLSEKYGAFRSSFALYLPNDTNAYHSIYLRLLRAWAYIVSQGLHVEAVEEIVRPITTEGFTELLIWMEALRLRRETKSPTYIDIRDLGLGLERALLAYLATRYVGPRILLWDDAEVALHPSLAATVIEWLSSLDTQVVLTTHSIDLLYALLKTYPQDAQVILLRKQEDDTIVHEPVELEELEKLVEASLDPRRLAELLSL